MTQPKQIITKYIAPTWIECAYCSARFLPTDPAQNDHWRQCPKHPARAELARLAEENAQLQAGIEALQAEVETLRRFTRGQERIQATLNSRLAEAGDLAA